MRCLRSALLLSLATPGLAAAQAGLATPVAGHAEAPADRAYRPQIPRTWTDEAIAAFELPLAHDAFSPRHVSQDYYDRLPVRTVWRSYPIYHPDREPPGYRERLEQLEPQVAFDPTKLETEQDWIDAGELVFRAPLSFDGPVIRSQDVTDPSWYAAHEIPLTADGVFPFARWVVRERGKLEVGNFACAQCHSRCMPDGSVIEGAQGNYPLARTMAARMRAGELPLPQLRAIFGMLTGTPWNDDERLAAMTLDQLADLRAAIPPGVLVRQGSSLFAPTKIPDLIGVAERKYLDATGLVIQRGIGDLMRYAAVNQSLDMLASYGGRVPLTGTEDRPPPGHGAFPGTADRYSDAQLFALAKFVYSLRPPPNPHRLDALARRGKQVFEAERCDRCHTPPLYTNNELVPAPGFDPPADHDERYDVSRRRVDTDPELATATRRGTGYYKVPSLKGLWYRGPLQHSGAVATLEDWFDPHRLDDDYVPTAFGPPGGVPAPVAGHRFGLDLSPNDKRALIAFLRTL